jgi:hypothetical protein
MAKRKAKIVTAAELGHGPSAEALKHPCGRCGAPCGQQCRDYRGKGKAACPGRADGSAKPRKKVTRAVFRKVKDLFDLAWEAEQREAKGG